MFVHGLGGHPRGTWEDSRNGVHRDHLADRTGGADGVDGDGSQSTMKRGRRNFVNLFRSRPLTPTTNAQTNETSPAPAKVFWPNDFLVDDIPEARVWTYGYNADAIGGLFQANNKDSVSQHGRDLAVRIDREIDNEVCPDVQSTGEASSLTAVLGPDPVRGA